MKILVQVLVRNNASLIPHFQQMFERLKPLADFELWFYENDSIDGTKELLFGNVLSETNPLPGLTRTQRLAEYRNKLKDHVTSAADFVLLIDSNIFFSAKSLETMLETMKSFPDVNMVVPHAMVKTSLPCTFYYDTFAVGVDQFTSLLPCEHAGPRHDRHCHRVTGRPPMIQTDERHHRLARGFGGFVLVRYEAFQKAKWSVNTPDDCEHWNFCSMIGPILLDRESRVIWVE